MGVRIVQVANFYGPASGGLRTTVDALGRGYADAGFERVLVVPGLVDGDDEIPSGRRITLRAPRLPGSGGYRVLRDLRAVRPPCGARLPRRGRARPARGVRQADIAAVG